jgi:hypothetical protein
MRFTQWKAFPRTSLLIATTIFVATSALQAQTAKTSPAKSDFQIGSSLEAIADPDVPRPNTKPCIVNLLTDQAFENFTNPTYSFTPPSECPGPWAKVVFTADFSIQPGVQYRPHRPTIFLATSTSTSAPQRRTAADPDRYLACGARSYRLQRALQDPQSGYASLGNIVGADGLNSIIFGTFNLEFYPADFRNPAPRTADLVLPLPDNGNGSVALNNAQSRN